MPEIWTLCSSRWTSGSARTLQRVGGFTHDSTVHFTMEHSASVELHNITVHPCEERDLAAEPFHRNRMIPMRARLDSLL